MLIAYRNKYVFETIKSAIENASNPERLVFKVMYQDSHHRKITFENSRVEIFYYKWDDNCGFSSLKNTAINNIKKSSYILLTGANSKFNKNWDIECLEKVLKKECVLSNKNNAIDSNFIFFKKEIIKDIKFPSYLKMLGESEDISIKLYCKGIDMISGLEGLVTMDNNDSYDYLPFSKTHNYNEVERLYKNGFNSYCSIQEEHSRYQEYSKMFNLKKVYDQINDVEYSDFDMPYLNPERFKYGKEKLTI